MEDLGFLDDVTNKEKNKESRANKGLPVKKEVAKKARTKAPKVSQTLRLDQSVRDDVEELMKRKEWSFSKVIEKILVEAFERGVKL